MRPDPTEVFTALGLKGTQFRLNDLIYESVTGVIRNLGRSLLTAVGTILGASAFVTTLGLTNTLGHQVSSTFDERRSTEVIVQTGKVQLNDRWYSEAALNNLRSLNGVQSAGARVTAGQYTATKSLLPGVATRQLTVQGVEPDALSVIGPQLVEGRLFDRSLENASAKVVLMSSSTAGSLGITKVGVALFIADSPFIVLGIFNDVERRPESLPNLVVPYSVAATMDNGSEIVHDVLIETAPGAGQVISRQAPLALRPEGASDLVTIAPPDPQGLRRQVESNVSQLSFLVSAITLIIGTVSIANAATASVTARTAEIGLRRALGARPRHIAAQLLGETTVLGLLGGVVGVIGGTAVVVITSLYQHWQPVLDVASIALAIAASATAGLLAGLAPATKAMRISPVVALQR